MTTGLQPTRKIFLVDDDALFLKSLEIDFLNAGNYDVVTFSTGENCIAQLSLEPDMIVLDYNLDGIVETAINGLETLDKIKQFKPNIPVVMLSSQDKIEVAVDCMRHRAIDYVVKSETAFFHLENIIERIFANRKIQDQLSWYVDRM